MYSRYQFLCCHKFEFHCKSCSDTQEFYLPWRIKDLLTRQYTFSSSRPALFQRGLKSSANQFWAHENLCGSACCLNCKASRICLISLLGFNVVEFYFLDESSTVFELVISGVFENLRIWGFFFRFSLQWGWKQKFWNRRRPDFALCTKASHLKDETLMFFLIQHDTAWSIIIVFSSKRTIPGWS